jgi:hypothetical protein
MRVFLSSHYAFSVDIGRYTMPLAEWPLIYAEAEKLEIILCKTAFTKLCKPLITIVPSRTGRIETLI